MNSKLCCQDKRVNTLSPRQDCKIDDIFKHVSLNEMLCILIQISPEFVPKGPIGTKLNRQEIIYWTDVKKDLRRHMASVDNNMLVVRYTFQYLPV